MTETKLRIFDKEKDKQLTAGDIYFADYLDDWMICLPIPIADHNQYRQFIEFALNTVASNGCQHLDKKPNRHRCWTVTGDNDLKNGDCSKLSLQPSILIEYEPGKSIHGYITNGVWKPC